METFQTAAEDGKFQQSFFHAKEMMNSRFDFYIGSNPGGRLITSIREAKNSIKIASPYLSGGAVELLREKHLGGLTNIAVITSAEESLSNTVHLKGLKKLIHSEKQKSLDKYEYSPIFPNVVIYKGIIFHAKFYIIDDEIAYIGSMNFTMKGMKKNIESNFTFKDADSVQDFIKCFDQLLSANFDKCNISELGEKVYSKIYHYSDLIRALIKKYDINTDKDDDYNKVTIFISNELKNKFSLNEKDLRDDKSLMYNTEITKEMHDYGLENIKLSPQILENSAVNQ
jgi:phosphatidylserine/phosphatidylglycerophosphate/cardiolipin synthase-like enzyme